MNRLRNRLIGVFLAATLVPLGVTLWIVSSLLDFSLQYASTRELDELSRALEQTGRAFYQHMREQLRTDAEARRITPEQLRATSLAEWPPEIAEFWASGETERFRLSGERGQNLDYLVRRPGGVDRYRRALGGVEMDRIRAQYAQARALIDRSGQRDLRRGFIYTLVVTAAGIWLVALAALVYSANHVSQPIQRLTTGLARLAAGDADARVSPGPADEVGRAIEAFNAMAGKLQQSQERLVLLTRLSSWQALGRKMAHELKNSLTPIRLTVEEIVARQLTREEDPAERSALAQAAQIIVDEVNSLERRVRAFSDLAAEPPVHIEVVDLNSVLDERVAFLRNAHPEVTYEVEKEGVAMTARTDSDLIKGVLTNLLENAAEAAGAGGVVRATARAADGQAALEVHDSGPGLSPQARQTIFEPTISFKKKGMGLGLSIARKSALLAGGDITLVKGELGGAGFRVQLPLCDSNESSCSTTKRTSGDRSS